MKMAARYREYALMLPEIITAIYARCIVPENAKKTKSAARDKNPIRVALVLHSVFQCQKNFGEMTTENGAPPFVPFIVKNGWEKFNAPFMKTPLVVNQKLLV